MAFGIECSDGFCFIDLVGEYPPAIGFVLGTGFVFAGYGHLAFKILGPVPISYIVVLCRSDAKCGGFRTFIS